ncbi:MAG: AEC family transporter [Acaryochloris sp. RU_4_1]|nr:AEC family transporter [Acaryochloris sp. RU_4_1]NJR55475.1 AEC family transporter [Acaryochloris sp. CRU_2_0]
MWQIVTSILWTALGLFSCRFIPSHFPKLLGRILYWVGVPLQILALARQSDFTQLLWCPPLTTILVLILGLGLALLSLSGLKRLSHYWISTLRRRSRCKRITGKTIDQSPSWIPWLSQVFALIRTVLPVQRSAQGSFVLASMLGNTGYVGLAIAPTLVNHVYLSWIVIYGVVHNLLGSYGLGVILAHRFGCSHSGKNWLEHLQIILCVPALWAFALGWLSRSLTFPAQLEAGLQISLWFVIPSAFLLIGMQLAKLKGLESLQVALVPVAIKMLVLPGLTGLGLTLFGISGDARLALVLMSGMPTAFANLILAEEYNLDSQLAASSILISTLGFPMMIPLWLTVFH